MKHLALALLLTLSGCAGLVPDDVRTQIQVDGAYQLGVQHGRQALFNELQAEQAKKRAAAVAPVTSQ